MSKKNPSQNLFLIPTEENVDFKIERKISRGKNLSISVQPTGKVILRVPKGLSEKFVTDFVSSKVDWIRSAIEKFKAKNLTIPELKFETGDSIVLFGEEFKLEFRDQKSETKLDSKNRILQIAVSKRADRKKTTKRILESYLKFFIQKPIQNYAKLLDVRIKNVKIKSMKSLWGSCSFDNSLSFNLALVHCKPEIIEYLIVHEICHTIEKNHSNNFWNLVKKLYPKYKTAELWLKTEGTKYIYLYR